MRQKLIFAGVLLSLAGGPGAALAADAGRLRPTQSFSVTVVIPDFAPAREARARGGVGVWALLAGSEGLAVSVPELGVSGDILVYRAAAAPVAASVVHGGQAGGSGPTGLSYGRPLTMLSDKAFASVRRMSFSADGARGVEYLLLSAI